MYGLVTFPFLVVLVGVTYSLATSNAKVCIYNKVDGMLQNRGVAKGGVRATSAEDCTNKCTSTEGCANVVFCKLDRSATSGVNCHLHGKTITGSDQIDPRADSRCSSHYRVCHGEGVFNGKTGGISYQISYDRHVVYHTSPPVVTTPAPETIANKNPIPSPDLPGCSLQKGNTKSQIQKKMPEKTNSAEECAEQVNRLHGKANGMTWVKSNRNCFAQFGATGVSNGCESGCLFCLFTGNYVEKPGAEGCGTATVPEDECKNAAKVLKYESKNGYEVVNYAHLPHGCFVGHAHTHWTYTYYNSNAGIKNPAFKSICKKE